MIRFFLEEAHADYTYTDDSGNSFEKIMQAIKIKADAENITMPSDFEFVRTWLEEHHSAAH